MDGAQVSLVVVLNFTIELYLQPPSINFKADFPLRRAVLGLEICLRSQKHLLLNYEDRVQIPSATSSSLQTCINTALRPLLASVGTFTHVYIHSLRQVHICINYI